MPIQISLIQKTLRSDIKSNDKYLTKGRGWFGERGALYVVQQYLVKVFTTTKKWTADRGLCVGGYLQLTKDRNFTMTSQVTPQLTLICDSNRNFTVTFQVTPQLTLICDSITECFSFRHVSLQGPFSLARGKNVKEKKLVAGNLSDFDRY